MQISLIVATLGWTVGIQRHPDEPVIFIHCQDAKKIPSPSGVQSWLTIPPPGGAPPVPMLGASTVAHTSRDSPSVTGLLPDEGVELADVDSTQNGQSMSQRSESIHASMPSEGGRSSPLAGSVGPPASLFATTAIRMDDTSILHPFFPQKSDAGPVRLMTIAHAFNYMMAVLRNGVKSAVRVARAWKAKECFLVNSDIPWGQQVAVMFQIVSTMALELPSFLGELEELRGMSPNVQFEPWGHDNHEDVDCECHISDRTAAYVHDLTVSKRRSVHSPDAGVASTSSTGSKGHLCIELGKRPPEISPICFLSACCIWTSSVSCISAVADRLAGVF